MILTLKNRQEIISKYPIKSIIDEVNKTEIPIEFVDKNIILWKFIDDVGNIYKTETDITTNEDQAKQIIINALNSL